MAIITFKNKGVRDIAHGENTKEARKCLPRSLHLKAEEILTFINGVTSIEGFERPGFRLKKLIGNREGQWALRINNQYRICFHWEDGDVYEVEIVDYH